jgi:diacylglycerol kinase
MQKFINGFVFAFRGIVVALCSQLNMKVHFAAAMLVIVGGIYYRLQPWEWVAVVLSIGLVMALELLNTAIEDLVNLIHPEWNVRAGRIKDLAAGAVLVGAVAALVVALIVFLPKI